MSDPDDSAERAPAGGMPPWRQPIEYNEGLEDDEAPDLAARSSFQVRPDKDPDDYFKFVNLQGEGELFDIDEPIKRDRLWYGRPDTPRGDEVVFGIEVNRWVLVYARLPSEEDDGSPDATEAPNRELSPADASRWFLISRHRIPEGLGPPRPAEESEGTTAPTRLDREWRPEPSAVVINPETSQSTPSVDDQRGITGGSATSEGSGRKPRRSFAPPNVYESYFRAREENPPSRTEISFPASKAYESYAQAIRENPSLESKTDKEAYIYIKHKNCEIDGYELPKIETWARYLRKARHYFGKQKNSPRAGREHGKSIVRRDEIEGLRTGPDER